MSDQLDQRTVTELKKKLEQRRTELGAALAGEADPVGDASEGREAEDDVDLASKEVLDEPEDALRKKHSEELRLVEAALRRIADGSYGKDASGRAIPVDRLKAIPWATS